MTHSAANQTSHVNLSHGHDAPATSGLYKNDISQSTKQVVKVGEFRDAYDALFRLVNVDFHACVGESELVSFQERLARRHREVASLECKRASNYDRDQFSRSLQAAENCYPKVLSRVEQSKRKKLGLAG
jgi:hypothetical protein